jgi:hypothetical protein
MPQLEFPNCCIRQIGIGRRLFYPAEAAVSEGVQPRFAQAETADKLVTDRTQVVGQPGLIELDGPGADRFIRQPALLAALKAGAAEAVIGVSM